MRTNKFRDYLNNYLNNFLKIIFIFQYLNNLSVDLFVSKSKKFNQFNFQSNFQYFEKLLKKLQFFRALISNSVTNNYYYFYQI